MANPKCLLSFHVQAKKKFKHILPQNRFWGGFARLFDTWLLNLWFPITSGVGVPFLHRFPMGFWRRFSHETG